MGYLWEVAYMQETAIAEQYPRTTEKKIAGVTYVVTTAPGRNASGTLKEKLKKLILESAHRNREELSEKQESVLI